MRHPRNAPTHGKSGCCPPEFGRVPNLSGSHELDAVIARNKNRDLPDRLGMHLVGGRAYRYGPRTPYANYATPGRTYSGDD